MARAKIEQHSLYLMGQLVGPNGKAITGNGLYPLPGFTLALPELTVGQTADGSNSKNESPLYFSDSSGRLQGWNTKVQSVEDLAGNKPSSPLLISSTTDKLKPVYIPPYLIPAAVMSEDTAWTERLAKLAKEVVSSQGKAIRLSSVEDWQIEEDLSKDSAERTFLAPELAEFLSIKLKRQKRSLGKIKARINACMKKFIAKTIIIIFIIYAFLKFGLSIFSSLPTILRARKLLCPDSQKT